jgi:glycosyltransferase involved in cell wall biosynthesis
MQGGIAANESVEFIGEINERQKADFLGNARALLFPIDWPEPSGLVMIEAMACGTPVIAFRSGSTPEVIDDGVTGFVVDTIDRAVEAVLQARALDRAGVRARRRRRSSPHRAMSSSGRRQEPAESSPARRMDPTVKPFVAPPCARRPSTSRPLLRFEKRVPLTAL